MISIPNVKLSIKPSPQALAQLRLFSIPPNNWAVVGIVLDISDELAYTTLKQSNTLQII